uniref:Uncharacterized protein n=1 Tax=Anguilla anguilla TaxID=7936 RepID=A0A0E9RAB5_ANGAN
MWRMNSTADRDSGTVQICSTAELPGSLMTASNVLCHIFCRIDGTPDYRL